MSAKRQPKRTALLDYHLLDEDDNVDNPTVETINIPLVRPYYTTTFNLLA
jgi:hypothetical protein